MHRRSVRSSLGFAFAAAVLAGAVSAGASTAPGAMVVAQTSFEERKVDFVTQTRDQVQKLRYQIQTFRRQLGESSNPQFEAARKDFEGKASTLTKKLDEIGALPVQQAIPRKPEVDSALQGVMAAYDRVVATVK
jgi:TolA-binding protein